MADQTARTPSSHPETPSRGLAAVAVIDDPTRPKVICLDCEHLRAHDGRGLCHYCYGAHQYAGTLDQYPVLRTSVNHQARMESFAEMYLRRPRPTLKELAAELGVGVRSIERYRAAYLRQHAQAVKP
ncbi:hypothetical protein DQ384_05070 [Sphaerisporangium album]|uniref:Uncharacterized protein n=1 Tax=Sphaerisporangium album TaxID=509200 RepID=A0A367FQD0_9ACTN|nr:hypothetical protein [Sphaerisporangium album]RCG31917.1 hypothetical protein DQ384_05070 [Sphaerisporangium album]